MPVDRDKKETLRTDRTRWVRPEVRRIQAGEAELGSRAGGDGLSLVS